MSVEDSRELLRRYARDGDEHAFRLLVERYAGLVYSAAQRKLGPLGAHTADVAQAVFIRLAQRAKVLPEEIVLPAWLHSMAVRYALNHLRAERRRGAREQIAHTMNADQGTPADPPLIASEIDEALGALPTRDREALLLRYIEDLDLVRTGRALGISSDAAQKRIARALERLRGQLLKRGVPARVTAVSACLASPMLRAAPHGFAATAAESAVVAGRNAAGNWMSSIWESLKAFPGPALAGTTIAILVSCAAASIVPREPHLLTPKPAPTMAEGGIVQAPASLTPDAQELMQLLRAQLSPGEIVAELGRTCMAQRTAINRARMAVLLELIGENNAAAVADLAERTLPLTASYRTIKLILERWCRYDAAATLGFVLERNLDAKFDDQSEPGIAGTLFRQWRKADRTASAAWLARNLTHPKLRNTGELALPLLTELASTSAPEAVAFVESLPPGPLRSHLMADACDHSFARTWTTGQWSALASAVASHSDGRALGDLSAVVREWASYHDTTAREWIESLPTGAQKLVAAVAVVAVESTWRNTSAETGGWSFTSVPVTNRAERATGALVAAGPEPRSSVLAQIAAAWPEPDESAVDWVRAQAERGAEADNALQVLSAKMAADSFEPSVRVRAIRVAAQITEASLRADVMAGLFLRWHLTDAATAEAWLTTAGLPADFRAILTDAIIP